MWVNECHDHSPKYIWLSEAKPTQCPVCEGTNINSQEE